MFYKAHFCARISIIRCYSINNRAFVNKHPNLSQMMKYVPKEYQKVSSKVAQEYLYLICPQTAKIIAEHVVNSVNDNQIVAETNVGLGLITSELLDRGVPIVRMYESSPEFRLDLKNYDSKYQGRVELFTKNFFHLPRYSTMDTLDGHNRVDSLLKNIPRRSWTDDPVMTVVGTMPNTSFIRYLIKSLALQRGLALYGRIQMFAILKKHHYNVLTTTPEQDLRLYQYTSILFQLLFDYEELETFPRAIFLPWESVNKKKSSEEMVLVKINFKKQFEIPIDKILHLYYFINQFSNRGNKNFIVSTIEKWVPGCGANILVPTMKHDDYFSDITLFTKFRELTPPQMLAIFKEMINAPSYSGSPFKDLIENELMKSETMETDLADAISERKPKKVMEKANLDYQDGFE
ncbi:unnamed protein product [Phyllotreta striolata]|uniref:Dimethyladenosine transferase 2, mitochondrial n=1 Tax=Phyllotreta striolata TaxID=444603 RepID=A0A9N9TUR2_PHYSR|nr:unnamed protein product [Phyllotreta striolata]